MTLFFIHIFHYLQLCGHEDTDAGDNDNDVSDTDTNSVCSDIEIVHSKLLLLIRRYHN